jgi:hypothetical protein
MALFDTRRATLCRSTLHIVIRWPGILAQSGRARTIYPTTRSSEAYFGGREIIAVAGLRTTPAHAVLVVEDRPDVGTVVVDLLEDIGCTVLAAGDGVSGLGIIDSPAPIDLLVSDVGSRLLKGRRRRSPPERPLPPALALERPPL